MTLCVSCLVMAPAAYASNALTVSCYDDDSQDVINQDGLSLPLYPNGYAKAPVPSDCYWSPSVTLSEREGFGRAVKVDGVEVYRSTLDSPIEARTAPNGTIAILTERGQLLQYNGAKLITWYAGAFEAVREFKLARDGELMAVTSSGQLVINGQIAYRGHRVEGLFASESNLIVALLDDGRIVSESGVLYSNVSDPAKKVKIAADGTVVFLTSTGRLGSIFKNLTQVMHSETVDPVVKFKVTAKGAVAYLTSQGRLGRDGQRLSTGIDHIVEFGISLDGSVTGVDAEGRQFCYPGL